MRGGRSNLRCIVPFPCFLFFSVCAGTRAETVPRPPHRCTQPISSQIWARTIRREELLLKYSQSRCRRLHQTSLHCAMADTEKCTTIKDAQSRTLYSAGVSGAIYAWDPEKMEEKYHLGGPGRDNRIVKDSHRDMVLCLKSFPTLETLASASMDRTIRLWDTQTGR